MSEESYRLYVGVDLGSLSHRVVVLDPRRTVIDDTTVRHAGAALEAWVTALVERAGGHSDRIAVAVEAPRGAVVDALLARGCHVFALNPKQLDRFRDRYTVAGAKDDRRDARVLGDALITDRAAFRQLAGDDPRLVELRELSRLDEELGEELTRLANRLREQLTRFFPQLLELSPAANEPWIWALLERIPSPQVAQAVPRAVVRHLLTRHRIRRVSVDAALALLRTAALPVAPGVLVAAQTQVAVLLPRLRLVATQRAACATRLEALLKQLEDNQEHRDVAILRSLPGVGRRVSATMLAEASRPLAARDYHALRVYVGAAPVTKQSGKRRVAVMRYACNARLRNAVHYWGQSAVRCDPRSGAHYAALRARGHSHGRALRRHRSLVARPRRDAQHTDTVRSVASASPRRRLTRRGESVPHPRQKRAVTVDGHD